MQAWMVRYSSIGSASSRFMCRLFGRRSPTVGCSQAACYRDCRYPASRQKTPCWASQVIAHTGMRTRLSPGQGACPPLEGGLGGLSVPAHTVRVSGIVAHSAVLSSSGSAGAQLAFRVEGTFSTEYAIGCTAATRMQMLQAFQPFFPPFVRFSSASSGPVRGRPEQAQRIDNYTIL